MTDLKVTMIEEGRLKASPTQPRKRFDQDKQHELTESMKQHGFTLSAVLVRPWPGDEGKNGDKAFEIVTGERRVRAAREAAIPMVPCFIRDLTDSQVLEMQLIENLQREDLTAIEEADGYRQILSLRVGNEPLYTIDSLATKLGRTTRTIRNQLSLCILDEPTKAEVEAGRLPPATAYLIACVPDATQRAKLAEMVLHPQKEEGPLSASATRVLLHKHFVRDLRTAAFDRSDQDLVPVELDEEKKRCAGGACDDCPLRAGNKTDGEVAPQKRLVCMNPACFERKTAADWVKWQAAENRPEEKRFALDEAQCRKLFAFGNQIAPDSGLVDLSEHPDGGDLKAGEDSPGTWRKLAAGAKIPVFVARDRFGKTRELVKRDMAIEAARTINKHEVFKAPARDKPAPETERKVEEKKKAVDRENDQAVLEAIVAEIQKRKIETSATALNFLRFLVDREITATKPTPDFLKRYHLPVGGSVMNQLKGRPAPELIAIMVDLIISEGGYVTDLHAEDSKWLKAILDIDCKAIAKQVIDERAKKEPPPGPYHLAKAVTIPPEKQTYGVVQGEYASQVKDPYSEHGLTKRQAEKRLAELNSRAPATAAKAVKPKKKAKR